MHIYSVNDPEFKSYGNVWDDVPSELTSPVLEALSATPIPEGSKYVASAPELEGVKDADKLGFLMFGGRPFQLGWCNGHNTRLNCLEYHRDSEFNLGTEAFILLLAKQDEMENGVLDTGSYGDLLDRSWVFRTIGYGTDANLWKDMMSTLRMIGYEGAVSIEHEDGLMSVKQGLEKAVAFLKEVMITEQPAAMWWA